MKFSCLEENIKISCVLPLDVLYYTQKGKSHRSGSTHIMTNYYLMRGMPSLLRIVAAISFSLVNLIKQIRKGDNEYPNLD